ncbi:poly(ADP-ribose) glycohydrolase ARH3-like isoform X3 [Varroa destructor]|uniref:ADP-ribosylhydrolase ARH3 n=1 Tax=Varroa destructor TaxID=109461 RepID=A0A7M7MAQ2_VARDE|nr:poly(ADP-ribose) glycohydrolase ARH3-like isoform X3 [Varroa destructor]XP_022662423.1 poly(ADP-ribose) glycohydrolase ARH3-like isoform X3 [Varroa destructor]
MEIPRRRVGLVKDDREAKYIDKYVGCLQGVLVGDCLGAPFDSNFDDSHGADDSFDYDVTTYLNNIRTNSVLPGPSAGRNHRATKGGSGRGYYCYTDVTATTLCLAKSLIRKRRFEPADIATRLTNEYFENESLDSEYGDAVRDVFRKWKHDGVHGDERLYGPARQQFGGMGSFGSGAAMRTAPVAIFLKDDLDAMIETTILQAKMTHAHPTGICAAVLHALALRDALLAENSNGAFFDGVVLFDQLIERMEEIEEELDGFRPLTYKLHAARKLLLDAAFPEHPPVESADLVRLLGNDMTAQGSVVTALACYIFGCQENANFKLINKSDNAFMRTLEAALRCGGDADTIASMACSLVGARKGARIIPAIVLRQCQAVETVTKNRIEQNRVRTSPYQHAGYAWFSFGEAQ